MFSTSSSPEIHHPATPWPLSTHLHSCSHFMDPLQGKAWNLGLSGASPVAALRGPFKSHYKPNETQLMKHRCPIRFGALTPYRSPVKINERSLVSMEMGSSHVNPSHSPIYEFINISNSRASESICGFWVSHFLETHNKLGSNILGLASLFRNRRKQIDVYCLSVAQAPGFSICLFLFWDAEVYLESCVLLGPRRSSFTDQTFNSVDNNTRELDQECTDTNELF